MHIHCTEPSRKRGTSGRHLAAGEEGSGGKWVGEGLAGAGHLRAVVTQSYTLPRRHAKSVAQLGTRITRTEACTQAHGDSYSSWHAGGGVFRSRHLCSASFLPPSSLGGCCHDLSVYLMPSVNLGKQKKKVQSLQGTGELGLPCSVLSRRRPR